MYATLHNARLSAVYTAVPAKEVRIEDELEHYGGALKKAERARAMIGTDKRRIAYPGMTASDLCAAAAERLLRERDIDKNSIDALIFVSQSPDYDLPATACVLQYRLGLSRQCAAFDVNQGCAGYVYGLWLAASLISSQSCKNVLLLVGDACYVPRDPKNRITTPIFGDGGSASLLQWDPSTTPLHFSVGTDGSGFGTIITPGGRSRIPYSRNFEENRIFFEDITSEAGIPWRLIETYMDGPAVFEFTLQVVPEHLKDFMQHFSLRASNIDWLILHQANKQIIQNVAEKAGFPLEKAPWESFGRYGNLASASIPSALCDLFGQAGTSGEQQLLLCGYGVGLSWASCFIEAQHTAFAPVFDFSLPANAPTTAMRLQQWAAILSGEKQNAAT